MWPLAPFQSLVRHVRNQEDGVWGVAGVGVEALSCGAHQSERGARILHRPGSGQPHPGCLHSARQTIENVGTLVASCLLHFAGSIP